MGRLRQTLLSCCFAATANLAAAAPYQPRRPEPPTLLWRMPIVRQGLDRAVIESQSTPLIDERRGQIVCGTGENEVWSLDLRACQTRWRMRYRNGFASAPGLFCRSVGGCQGEVGDTIAIGAKDGVLLALDARRGTLAWQAGLDAEVRARPLDTPDGLLATTARNGLVSLEPATGAVRWRLERPAPTGMTILGHAAPLWREGVVFTSFSDGFALAARASDGTTLWQRPLSLGRGRFRDADATPVSLERAVAFASLTDGVYALDPNSGEPLWQQPIPEISVLAATTILRGTSILFAGTADGTLVALHGATGRPLWQRPGTEPDGIVGLAAVADVLYVLSSTNGLRIVRQRDGKTLASSSLGGRPGGQLALASQHAAHITSQGALLVWQFAPYAE